MVLPRPFETFRTNVRRNLLTPICRHGIHSALRSARFEMQS